MSKADLNLFALIVFIVTSLYWLTINSIKENYALASQTQIPMVAWYEHALIDQDQDPDIINGTVSPTSCEEICSPIRMHHYRMLIRYMNATWKTLKTTQDQNDWLQNAKSILGESDKLIQACKNQMGGKDEEETTTDRDSGSR